MVSNTEVAEVLQEVSDFYRVEGDEHRARVYSKAAISILKLDSDLEDMETDELQNIEGVGDSILGDVSEIIETGHCSRLDQSS